MLGISVPPDWRRVRGPTGRSGYEQRWRSAPIERDDPVWLHANPHPPAITCRHNTKNGCQKRGNKKGRPAHADLPDFVQTDLA